MNRRSVLKGLFSSLFLSPSALVLSGDVKKGVLPEEIIREEIAEQTQQEREEQLQRKKDEEEFERLRIKLGK